jgi:hypothetical protein
MDNVGIVVEDLDPQQLEAANFSPGPVGKASHE